MKPTHTGIAVALALTVVAVFFIFPNASPFGGVNANSQAEQQAAIDAALQDITTDETSPTTMTNENPAQLKITDTVVGTGEVAKAGDKVTVNYVGAFTNGKVFDASANNGTQGFTFTLGAGQVIKGWDQGVAGMRVGGRRNLVIPASLGYGEQDYGPIPGNSTLVFDVELLKISN